MEFMSYSIHMHVTCPTRQNSQCDILSRENHPSLRPCYQVAITLYPPRQLREREQSLKVSRASLRFRGISKRASLLFSRGGISLCMGLSLTLFGQKGVSWIMTDTQQQQNPALPAEEKEKRVGSGAGRASGRLPGLEDLAAR
ncbi:hypothetical protein AG1IA_01675 [Rhizoctonia solani AG-1 IA]|uniref:Uncharacterized protein n=1 Tax=Thanatephorus cucumeris (strain AG1-IA) TaxID=983506 RepID=L8X6Q2_THACA|nr:hypothetical protein AG1IA_01675 [Rhizoctonia solani AG-1 IA]